MLTQASAAISNLATNDRNKAEIKDKWGWSAKVMYHLESASAKYRYKHIEALLKLFRRTHRIYVL